MSLARQRRQCDLPASSEGSNRDGGTKTEEAGKVFYQHGSLLSATEEVSAQVGLFLPETMGTPEECEEV